MNRETVIIVLILSYLVWKSQQTASGYGNVQKISCDAPGADAFMCFQTDQPL